HRDRPLFPGKLSLHEAALCHRDSSPAPHGPERRERDLLLRFPPAIRRYQHRRYGGQSGTSRESATSPLFAQPTGTSSSRLKVASLTRCPAMVPSRAAPSATAMAPPPSPGLLPRELRDFSLAMAWNAICQGLGHHGRS